MWWQKEDIFVSMLQQRNKSENIVYCSLFIPMTASLLWCNFKTICCKSVHLTMWFIAIVWYWDQVTLYVAWNQHCWSVNYHMAGECVLHQTDKMCFVFLTKVWQSIKYWLITYSFLWLHHVQVILKQICCRSVLQFSDLL